MQALNVTRKGAPYQPKPGRGGRSLLLGLFSEAPHLAPGGGGGLVAEGLQDGPAVGVAAGQDEDAVLGLAQPLVATLDETDALLVAGQGVFQAEAPVLQLADQALQLDERVLETRRVGGGFVHGRVPSWVSFGQSVAHRGSGPWRAGGREPPVGADQ